MLPPPETPSILPPASFPLPKTKQSPDTNYARLPLNRSTSNSSKQPTTTHLPLLNHQPPIPHPKPIHTPLGPLPRRGQLVIPHSDRLLCTFFRSTIPRLKLCLVNKGTEPVILPLHVVEQLGAEGVVKVVEATVEGFGEDAEGGGGAEEGVEFRVRVF